MKHRLLYLMIVCLVLGACTSEVPSYPTSQTHPETTQDSASRANGDNPTDDANAPANGKHTVTLALLTQSRDAQDQGNLTEATTYVERAIRINPRRADLWVQLGRLQLAQSSPQAAQRYAQKAITLAGNRLDWIRDAWLLIAQAKQAQGHTEEANEIRNRWRSQRG